MRDNVIASLLLFSAVTLPCHQTPAPIVQLAADLIYPSKKKSGQKHQIVNISA